MRQAHEGKSPNPAAASGAVTPKRTRAGSPLQTLVSFWALRGLPARAAELNRWHQAMNPGWQMYRTRRDENAPPNLEQRGQVRELYEKYKTVRAEVIDGATYARRRPNRLVEPPSAHRQRCHLQDPFSSVPYCGTVFA